MHQLYLNEAEKNKMKHYFLFSSFVLTEKTNSVFVCMCITYDNDLIKQYDLDKHIFVW